MIFQKRVKLVLQTYENRDVGYYIKRVTWCLFGIPVVQLDSVVVKGSD